MAADLNHKTRQSIALACLVLIILAVYANTLLNGFIYDDNFQIVENPWIRSFSNIPRIFATHSFGFTAQPQAITYRPAVFLLFMAEYAVFGLKPGYWHLVNIFLHSANTVIVFLIVSFIFKNMTHAPFKGATAWAPVLSSAVFAIHPVNSETVAWIGCAPELIYTFFGLISLYYYIMSRRPSEKKAVLKGKVLSAIFFLFALFAKETAVILPVVFFAYDRVFHSEEKIFSLSVLKRLLPFILAFSFYFVIRLLATGGVVSGNSNYAYLTAPQHVLNAFVLFGGYIKLLIFPAGNYPFKLLNPALSLFEPWAFLSVISTFLAFFLIYRWKRSLSPVYLFAFLIIIIPIIPALYIKGISRHAFADRYLYFPSAGFGLFIGMVYGELVSRTVKNQVALSVVFLALIALYGFKAAERNLDWKTNISLWEASIKGDYNNFGAHYYLGIEYNKKGEFDLAVQHFKESIKLNRSAPNRLKNMEQSSHIFLGSIYVKKKLLDEALLEYENALKIHPASFKAVFNAGSIYRQKGLNQKALEMFKNALNYAESGEQFFHVYMNLAECHEAEGLKKTALDYYEMSLKIEPGNNKISEKISSLRAALEKEPGKNRPPKN